jgi:RNA polymerase sigma factor (TIGR02999 family)
VKATVLSPAVQVSCSGGGVLVEKSGSTFRHLLNGLGAADPAALAEIIAILYAKLRGLAHQQRRRWSGDETIGTTALVHEAYLKLKNQKRIDVANADHFLALASTAMRHILSNYAEQRHAQKRGGGMQRVPIGDLAAAVPGPGSDPEDMLAAMSLALRRLEQYHARSCRVVECRFYGGLTVEQTAAALGISPRTVKRDWVFAQAWLKREVKELV